MKFRKLISVGNDEKGFALFDRYNGEFLSGFEYSSIIISNFGVNFLFQGENSCKIVDCQGKELNFDNKYLWAMLANSVFGIAGVFNQDDGKCYLGSYEGKVLSNGYLGTILPLTFTEGFGGLFMINQRLPETGKTLKGLLSLSGEEVVSPTDEFLPVYDDIFILSGLVERYGFGMMICSSDDILKSSVAVIKLFESTLRYLYNIPSSVGEEHLPLFFANICKSFSRMLENLCISRNIYASKKIECEHLDIVKRFGELYKKIVQDFKDIVPPLYINILSKSIFDTLEHLGVNFNYKDIEPYLA